MACQPCKNCVDDSAFCHACGAKPEAELSEPDKERVAALREHWLHACGS